MASIYIAPILGNYVLEINGTHSYQINEKTSMTNIHTMFYKENIFFLPKSN